MIIFLTILVFFFSCTDRSKNAENLKPKASQQEVIKDIPVSENGKLAYSYTLTKEYIQKANLEVIEKGFDSICIRLWYCYGFGPWQIVEIKKDNKEWLAEFILLTEVRNKVDSSTSIKKTSISATPKSGWDFFLKEFFSKNIITLPTSFSISGYELVTDGDFFITEIATKNHYRIYSYSALKFNLNIKQAREMADVILLIEKEFGVERLNKDF